jgi:hypothetical protein
MSPRKHVVSALQRSGGQWCPHELLLRFEVVVLVHSDVVFLGCNSM